MANEDDDINNDLSDTSVLVKRRSKLKKPPLYKVLLLNDDFTPNFARVNTHKEVRFETLRKVIGKTPQSLKDRIPKRPRKMLSKTIRKYNSKHAERKKISPETDNMLRSELVGEIDRLETICGRDLNHWRV